MNKIFLAFMAFYTCATAQSVDFSSVNYAGSAAEYLRLPLHASSAGLGSAVVASRDDLQNARYNPAILDALPESTTNMVGTFSILTFDRKHYGADVAHSCGTFYVLGLSYMHYGVAKIDGRDKFGEPTGDFEYGANAITASAAGRVTNSIALGATIRYINEKLQIKNAHGIGFDIGATYLPLPYMSLGASVQHLGSYLWWNTGTADPILPTGRVGISGQLLNKTLLIETDFIKTQKQPEELSAGVQYYFLDFFFLRGGITSAVNVEKQSSRYPAYSLGLGVRYFSLGFDYACLIPDSRGLESELGIKHKLSLCASIKKY